MFRWLGLALLIDGLDGPLARKLNVGEVLPNWSGDTLDLVVDFLTYVFVPAYAITASGLLIQLATPLLGGAIVISGALDLAVQCEGNGNIDDCLRKPFAPAELADAVGRFGAD